LLFQGKEFSTSEMDDEINKLAQDFVTPGDFGMRGRMTSTAYGKGFSATYEIVDETLCLRSFGLRKRNGSYLPIGGILPQVKSDGSYGRYNCLNLLVEFTGTVRIAAGSNEDPTARRTKTRMEPPFPYAKVIELKLMKGRLVSTTDQLAVAGGDIEPLVPMGPPSQAMMNQTASRAKPFQALHIEH
jgi:hypothetical protein